MTFFLKGGSSLIVAAECSTSGGDLYWFSMDPHMGMGQPHGRFVGPSESGLHSSVMREPHPTVWTVVEYFQVSSLGARDTVACTYPPHAGFLPHSGWDCVMVGLHCRVG